VIVDIDKFEMNKFKNFDRKIELKIHSDAKSFLQNYLKKYKISKKYSEWINTIQNWRKELKNYDDQSRIVTGLNPYLFMKKLILSSPSNVNFYLDTGCLLPWILQDLEPKKNHRFFHDFNNTAMGWSIPALAGGLIANPSQLCVGIVGDGSFMMSIQELAVLSKFQKPVLIILIDNSGYSMIRQTQDQWFNSNYFSSSTEDGLKFPNFKKIAEAFEFEYDFISNEIDMIKKVKNFYSSKSHKILHVKISASARVIPQVKFGRPNEDMEPLMPRTMFDKYMIIHKNEK
jgi:acetolactate synthase-1/2/3 large subunit